MLAVRSSVPVVCQPVCVVQCKSTACVGQRFSNNACSRPGKSMVLRPVLFKGRITFRKIYCRTFAAVASPSCHLVRCWLSLQWSDPTAHHTLPDWLTSCPSISVLVRCTHMPTATHNDPNRSHDLPRSVRGVQRLFRSVVPHDNSSGADRQLSSHVRCTDLQTCVRRCWTLIAVHYGSVGTSQ